MRGSSVLWKVLAVVFIILAAALGVYGAITFAAAGGFGAQKWVFGVAFLSLGIDTWHIIAAPFWIVGTILFFMELFGYTLKGFKVSKYKLKWDSVDIATAALSAAVYGGGLAATGGLTIIPGFTWIRPANALAPLFGLLFGVPGALGVAIGNLLADSLAGYLGWGSLGGGFIGNFLLAYVPYKFVRDHSLRDARSVAEYYLFGVILGSVWCSFYISWFLSYFNTLTGVIGLPPIFVWGIFSPFVIINNAIAEIFTPLLVYPLYPLVKNWGLHWSDRIQWL